MTSVLLFGGIWLALAFAVAIRLGQVIRLADQRAPKQPEWVVPDDVAGLMRELEESR